MRFPSHLSLIDVHATDSPPRADITSSITYAASAALTDLGPLGADGYHDVNDTALVPIPAEAQLPPANHTIPLLVVFDTTTAGTNRAFFNDITYNTPQVPTILSALTLDAVAGAGSADVAGAYGPWNFILEQGETVDLVVMNSDAGKHPLCVAPPSSLRPTLINSHPAICTGTSSRSCTARRTTPQTTRR